MSKKDEVREIRRRYNEYAKTVNVHIKPTRGVNSGAHGRDFEARVKTYLGNMNGLKIASSSNNYDTIKKGFKIEVKTGNGEICQIMEDGTKRGMFGKSDYVVYALTVYPDCPVEHQAVVCPACEFIERLEDAGLTRLKASTAVYKAVQSGFLDEIYYDRESIQINSIRKENKLWDILEDIGMSLDEFKINILEMEG